MPTQESLISTLLSTTEHSLVPLTRAQVSAGSKVFGAAILSREDLKPLTLATNNERASPLLHGEINCIQKFFLTDYPNEAERPNPKDCIFFATHEPCSLCLSGITWSGFNEFYYLFTYDDTKDTFAIPYDIEILKEVYQVPAEGEPAEALAQRPLYNRSNKFFQAKSVAELVEGLNDEESKEKWRGEVKRVKALYGELAEAYAKGKEAGHATSSVFK